jgi:hypothetical protein
MTREPELVMALVTAPDGTVESEALFIRDDGRTLSVELPDGSVVSVDDVEFDSARRAA